MSNFKIFDGTNWVDPCECNISILDVDGITYQQINPNNCIVSYFDGTNWCPITCPCECPAGYTFNATTNSCEQVEIIPATPLGGDTVSIGSGDTNSAYGDFGARLYENITGKIYPLNGWQNTGICSTCSAGYQVAENAGLGTALVIQQVSASNSDIFNAQGTTTLGRLNNVGLWATGYPDNQWLDVEFCINIITPKTYIFAIAGDNQVKAEITSTTFNGGGTFNLVNLWASDSPTGSPVSGTTNPFKLWHMFPITLPAGSHTLKLSGYNFGSDSAFGAEIYDISELDLINLMTSATATAVDLQPYIIFSTESLITTPPLVVGLPGETITWACPDGYTYSLCYGAPSCVIVNSIPCGTGQILTLQSEINIWFDNSGTMNTTLSPLEIMRQSVLKEVLLPIYNYDEALYNSQVRIVNMQNADVDYRQRFVKCLGQEAIESNADIVINLVFSDKSVYYGYSTGELFDSSVIDPQYQSDISHLRSTVISSPYPIKGTMFRVNSGPNANIGFRGLTQATFVNNGNYIAPNNLSDFYGTNFNCNLDTLAAGSPAYYKNQIIAALTALNISIPII